MLASDSDTSAVDWFDDDRRDDERECRRRRLDEEEEDVDDDGCKRRLSSASLCFNASSSLERVSLSDDELDDGDRLDLELFFLLIISFILSSC